ncbi:MAG: endo-1,4-beta-xylanase, partial [Candidatus Azobacteroides sp.]|nr:endo-1,4-beta-xylanase [Candidatus Azobacteroides sp.]
SGSSSLAMEIIQTVTSLGSSWHLQIESPGIPTVVGHNYKVTFWAKASVGSCVAQYEWDHAGSPIYNSANLTTDWAQYTLTFGNGGATPLKATKDVSTIAFDMAYNPVGAIIYIDNVVVTDQTVAEELAAASGTPEQRTANIDAALHNWINNVVTHYKGQVVGWDVVTDLFTDNGAIRTNANTPNTNAASDWFVWSEFLGKNTGVAAFKYAHDADPNALLFINESGLETYGAKLDSLINYVQWLQGQGAPIDGIGVKMHIAINTTTRAGYDYLFQRLAATGLKVRISELDVQVNGFPSNTRYFELTPQVLGYQAQTYKDVVSSYLKNVPAAQRQDITIWGVNDGNSWLYNNNRGNDFPLLFDDNFAPKPAYGGVLQALQGQ